MIKLSITATKHPITVQDPRPVTQNNTEQGVISVFPGAPADFSMQWGQYERISAQLNSLAQLGMCSFTVGNADGPGFAAQADAPENPAIDLVTGAIAAATGGTGILITGVNLLNGQTFANASLLGAAGTGSVKVSALLPGYDGNKYDIVVIDTGALGLAISAAAPVDGRVVVTVNLGTDTPDCTTVAAQFAIDVPTILTAAVVGTATDLIGVQSLQALTDGAGTGVVVTVGGVAGVVTAIDTTIPAAEVITFDVGAVGTAGDVAKVILRSSEKVADASVVLG